MVSSPPRRVSHAANFVLPLEMVEWMLQQVGMPKNIELQGVEFDFRSAGARFWISGPDLPEIGDGEIAKTIFPKINVTYTPVWETAVAGHSVKNYGIDFKHPWH